MDLARLEELATARLDPVAADYINRGSAEGLTRAANLAAWRRLELRPHVLVFVDGVSVRTGAAMDTPVPDGAEVFVAPAVSGG